MNRQVGAIYFNRLCCNRPVGGCIATHRAVARAGHSGSSAPELRRRSMHRPYLKWRAAIAAAFVIVCLTSCATISRHQFAEPTRDWQARSGQLLYRTAKTTLIGEVLIRFSKKEEFVLTFSKGPGVTLVVLREDARFAEIKGPLARQGWSGPIEHAPQQLRGWLDLRDKLIHVQDRQSVRHVAGAETFLFHF